ncbi:hypothetical protein Micbo1qcDRAFT_214325 [Microdochium bolleyi]|uniref:Uncharacterized protein n=1 Tax=Microdochium bolleyi TaxID=196109 RepID=A0A136IU70_9PEZI|nr:hypothetical protein Micbo1qcDRAFT_214325 [Microdochium bolleyi]
MDSHGFQNSLHEWGPLFTRVLPLLLFIAFPSLRARAISATTGACKWSWGCLKAVIWPWTYQTTDNRTKITVLITAVVGMAFIGAFLELLSAFRIAQGPVSSGAVASDPTTCRAAQPQPQHLYRDLTASSTDICRAILAASKDQIGGDGASAQAYFVRKLLEGETGGTRARDEQLAMIKAFLLSRKAEFKPFCAIYGIDLSYDGIQR